MSNKLDVFYMSRSNEWSTPQWLFDLLNNYKDFDSISIRLANGVVVFEGKFKDILLDHVLFIGYHEVYSHSFDFENKKVFVRIK